MSALGVFDTLFSGATRSETAGLGRRFSDMGSLRAAIIKAPSLGSRLLLGLSEGVAKFGRVVLVGWRCSGRVFRAVRRGALGLF
jgi:hypothetical protein